MQETGAPEAVARNALAAHNGNYVRAKSAYTQSRSQSSAGGGVATLTNLSGGKSGGPGAKKQNELFGGGHSSGIATLGPRRDEEDEDEDEGDSGNDSRRGASGAGKSNDVASLVNGVLDQARRQGAQTRDPADSASAADRFGGSGQRLGDGGVSPIVTPASAKKPEPLVITFYRNGFTTAAAGPLRAYDDPAQKSFLDSINQGRVPDEFRDRIHAGVLDVSLADHKNEDWSPPGAASGGGKPQVAAFTGAGQTLGAASASSKQASAPPPPPVAGARQLTVDETQPVTSLRVRLLDGRQIVVKCNQTHTIADVRAHVDFESAPVSRYVFVCTSMRPPKRDLNESQTVKEADLLNATLHQTAN
jgi:UBX domain-containing protein 1